ncbi:MAG: MFS transporter [Deltaproteobacteria bacterium]|nr:MFS transporter [Deltaproteobacteria bacterium]
MGTEQVSYRWWVLINTFLIFAIAFGMGWTYIVMLVPPILQELGLNIADWGALWSAISFGTVLFAIIGGALGDRFGIRLTVGLGVFFMGGFLVLRGTASSFATLYVWMFLFGIALALTFANVPKALGMWFPPREFGLANGVTQAGYGAGAGLATILTPLVVDLLGGWRNLTYLLGTLTMGLGLLWIGTVRDRATSVADAGVRLGAGKALKQVLLVKDIWIVAGCYFLFLGGYIGLIGYAPTYFVSVQGMSAPTAGVVISIVMWAYVVGTSVIPTLSDRVGLRKIFFVSGMFLTGICIFLAAYALGISLWIVAALWGFMGGAAVLAFVVPLEMKEVGPTLAGSALGVAATAGYLGGFIAPPICMGLASVTPVAGFAFGGGCYVLSALLFLLIKETGPRVRKQPELAPSAPHIELKSEYR